MSDPYGHGETCACDRCTAYSEGLEAGTARATRRLPKLDQMTAYINGTWHGLWYALPPSGAAYVIGLLHGLFDEETADRHLKAIDTILRLHETRGWSAGSRVVTYLREHGIGDYRPRQGFARTPEDP